VGSRGVILHSSKLKGMSMSQSVRLSSLLLNYSLVLFKCRIKDKQLTQTDYISYGILILEETILYIC
jgi:hypothetical protein